VFPTSSSGDGFDSGLQELIPCGQINIVSFGLMTERNCTASVLSAILLGKPAKREER
jgi:hypothetical protein